MQRDLAESVGRDEPVGVGSVYEDGGTRTIRTRVKWGEAVDLFSDERFGNMFSYWEDIIRPRVERLLGVPVDTAESDIMGEWRLLRNWLTHPTVGGHAEQQYFSRAKTLPQLLDYLPSDP